ncbi:MAG: DUF1177 domain-containing protein [Lachnospiraceae bacterium]|nr:DUF1177 domain-containing protein [Lachnospiraceae bacterium]
MLLKQILEIYDILDDIHADGEAVVKYLKGIDPEVDAETYPLTGEKGTTHMVKVRIPGTNGKSVGGSAPTLGILGRLGGLGARPEMIGFVSDGDGALAALAIAAKVLDMRKKGDALYGDLFISTHICPTAPTRPHDPVPFMDSPVSIAQVNKEEVSPDLDAILSIDTTKGNRIINTRGFAISQPVKKGWILREPEEMLDIMQRTTGRLPYVFAVNMQDITPYGNDVHHLNSIMQPCTCTEAPVIGVAITTETMVPGCGTGCSHYDDIEEAARFCLEVAKEFGQGHLPFYDPADYEHLQKLYGSMEKLQTLGNS